MKDTEHVYCTKCINGENLLEAIYNDSPIPEECSCCYPYDPEDSRPLYQRKNYKEEIE
jgi:hypothetical protein